MSVDQADVIDGIGLDEDGTKVTLLISDHLSWDDPGHLPLLAKKVEAYASTVLSGKLGEAYPQSENKPVTIRLVYRDLPNQVAQGALQSIEEQLGAAGIGFERRALPHDY